MKHVFYYDLEDYNIINIIILKYILEANSFSLIENKKLELKDTAVLLYTDNDYYINLNNNHERLINFNLKQSKLKLFDECKKYNHRLSIPQFFYYLFLTKMLSATIKRFNNINKNLERKQMFIEEVNKVNNFIRLIKLRIKYNKLVKE